jgi:hypothetical protein
MMPKFYEGRKVYINGDYPTTHIDGKNHYIHRLQWVKYHGEIPNGYVVHHKDGDKTNWDIDNLELISRAEHIMRHKNVVKRPAIQVIARKGEQTIVLESIEQAALFCGTYTACIHKCFNGEQKTSNGWTFERLGKKCR